MEAFSTIAAPVRKRVRVSPEISPVSPDNLSLPVADPVISEANTLSKGLRKPIGNLVAIASRSIFFPVYPYVQRRDIDSFKFQMQCIGRIF